MSRKMSNDQRLAIVVSRFNAEITGGLLNGATQVLAEQSAKCDESDIFYVPGAFEIPLIAKSLAKSGRYVGIICLGCVIKGETAHFEFISLGVTVGLMQASLECEVPMTFGILTTYTDAQAEDRSRLNAHNKGRETALACLEAARTLAEAQGRIKRI
ncbi:MAG: 6,7-dimethyl-8-ribityllumazine synthase [Bdellovibrionota bacterium]